MNYGLPYKGSKNAIAERLIRTLPRRTHLIDLFCGGCAVSHAALLGHKFQHVHINDFNWMMPQFFTDALAGKFNDERRWVSREDFFKLRDVDPYVAVVWSFGNRMRSYIYAKEIEPYKKALHYAILFDDYSLGHALGFDLAFLADVEGVAQKYAAVKQAAREGRLSFGGGTVSASNCKASKGATECEAYHYQQENLTRWQRVVAIGRMGAEATHRPHAASIGGGQRPTFTSSALDYAEVAIPESSVIYCDIPYIGTDKYNGAERFDYERFYQWAEQQSEPVFISSYEMPADRFDCVQEWKHISTLNDHAVNQVTERLFVPKHQTERGYTPRQLQLF